MLFSVGSLDIFHDRKIIFRHLTSDNVNAIIVRAADNASFQCALFRKHEMINFNHKLFPFTIGKELVCNNKRKSIGADIV